MILSVPNVGSKILSLATDAARIFVQSIFDEFRFVNRLSSPEYNCKNGVSERVRLAYFVAEFGANINIVRKSHVTHQ